MRPIAKLLTTVLAASSLTNPMICPVAAQETKTTAERWAGDGDVPPFYRWDQPIPTRPGIMLRTATAPADVSIPAAGRAERMLYSSTDWKDAKRPTTVSGITFFPKGEPPAGGWPVIAWAHGTTGIADGCAPSVMPRSVRDTQYLGYWLDHGYAVVASDYAGLGTPGVHPYLNYRSEGISVLDAIRAALARYPELNGDKLVTVGQSQGSEGALAAAYLAPTYAPELKIRGTVATGIVAHTENVGKAAQLPSPKIYMNDADYGNSAYEILWFLGTARPLDPQETRPADYLSAGGWAMLAGAQKACFHGLLDLANEQKLPFSQFYKQPIDALERRTRAGTGFPDVHIATPVFTGTGLEDHAADPVKQYNFISAMCAAGTPVQWHYYPGKDHSGAVPASLADSPAFVSAVMAGKKPADTCAKLTPPPRS
ncbi:lipase family protein [Stakelama sp. CBK3Z-3]|uniref:Lipase family protein n=1 Tax=Stakelama flava TaxID=2860338 RepID=A0ABS6XQX7_9SPHN|nr:lipase family protein [Stakelama flava]MBW4331815.1 lipase family protein [Stakelama flava]